jgi:hypothetical protein
MNNLSAAILLCLWASSGAAEANKPGRAVFQGLPEASGHVVIGNDTVAVSRFPCQSCHRRDGRGGAEGDAPPINWETLARPSGTRPAYDATSFAHLLATGETPSGSQISRLMPRYALDESTVNSLVSYLSALTAEQKTGIYPDRIVFGVPVSDEGASNAHLLVQTLETAFSERIPPNGLHGRQVEIRPLRGDAASIVDQARTETVAILSPPPSSHVDHALFTRAGVPVLFPLDTVSENEDPDLIRSLYASHERVTTLLIEKGVTDGCQQIVIAAETPSKAETIRARLPQLHVATTMPSDGFSDCILIVGARVSPEVRDKTSTIYVQSDDGTNLQAMLRGYRGKIVVGRHEATALRLAAARDIGPLQAHAALIAEALHDALTSAGRQVTRTSLMSEISAVSRHDLGLEFTRNSTVGSAAVDFQVFEFSGENAP